MQQGAQSGVHVGHLQNTHAVWRAPLEGGDQRPSETEPSSLAEPTLYATHTADLTREAELAEGDDV